ncbi:hypothetical protein AGOR_G00248960 [Albula goreensis]|uniref:PH domain-containing protein n=1 Tax=Albula goreensis TaxID=1534307 RepID=A0A8T3CE05_9TELE|nr:hypothetical protein AGOR_G00248960 [Albula goreensis]
MLKFSTTHSSSHNERKVTCKHPISGLPSQDTCIFILSEQPVPKTPANEKKDRPLSTMTDASICTSGSDYATHPGSPPGRPSRPSKKVHNFGKRSNSIKRNPNAPVVRSGWLFKQDSAGMKLWKKRWFVLSDMCLFYYRDEKEEGILGSILLPSFHISMLSVDDHINKKYSFKATHPNMRTYYFCTDTAKDMESWMRVMTDAALVHTEPIKRQKMERCIVQEMNSTLCRRVVTRHEAHQQVLVQSEMQSKDIPWEAAVQCVQERERRSTDSGRAGESYDVQKDGAERPRPKSSSSRLQPSQAAAIVAAVISCAHQSNSAAPQQVSQYKVAQVNGAGDVSQVEDVNAPPTRASTHALPQRDSTQPQALPQKDLTQSQPQTQKDSAHSQAPAQASSQRDPAQFQTLPKRDCSRSQAPPQEPEKTLQRTNSMQQLEQWVRIQRGRVQEDDTRSISSYLTLPRKMPSQRAQVVSRYPEGYRTLPRNSMMRPDSICSLTPSLYDRALGGPSLSSAEKRRSMRDDTMWQLYEWRQRQTCVKHVPQSRGSYSTLPNPRTLIHPSDHMAPSIPTSPSHGSLARCQAYPSFSSYGADGMSSHLYQGDATIDRRHRKHVTQYVYPPDRRLLTATIPVQTVTAQSLQSKTPEELTLLLIKLRRQQAELSTARQHTLAQLLQLNLDGANPKALPEDYRDSSFAYRQDELDIDVKLSRLCEQDKVVRTQEHKLQQLYREKHTLETALLSASQEIEMSAGDQLVLQSVVQQRDLLQSGLLSTCRELSRTNASLERSWREYDRLEADVTLIRNNLLEQLEALGTPQTEPPSQQHVQIQKELWRIQDVTEALNKNRTQRSTEPLGTVSSKAASNQQKSEVSAVRRRSAQSPRPPLPQYYDIIELPPAVPPLPGSVQQAVGHTLPSRPEDRKHGQRNGSHSGPDYRLYKSEPELTTVAEVEESNGDDKTETAAEKEPASTKGLSYPVGVVSPRTKSPIPESSTIASYVTMRKGRKPDPKTERPHSAVEQAHPAEMGRPRMSVEEQLERIRRHRQGSLRGRKKGSSFTVVGRTPDNFHTMQTRKRSGVSPEIQELLASLREQDLLKEKQLAKEKEQESANEQKEELMKEGEKGASEQVNQKGEDMLKEQDPVKEEEKELSKEHKEKQANQPGEELMLKQDPVKGEEPEHVEEQRQNAQQVEEQKQNAQQVEEQKQNPQKVEVQKPEHGPVKELKQELLQVDEQKLEPVQVEEQKLGPEQVEEQKLDPEQVEEQKHEPEQEEEQKCEPEQVEEQKREPEQVEGEKQEVLQVEEQNQEVLQMDEQKQESVREEDPELVQEEEKVPSKEHEEDQVTKQEEDLVKALGPVKDQDQVVEKLESEPLKEQENEQGQELVNKVKEQVPVKEQEEEQINEHGEDGVNKQVLLREEQPELVNELELMPVKEEQTVKEQVEEQVKEHDQKPVMEPKELPMQKLMQTNEQEQMKEQEQENEPTKQQAPSKECEDDVKEEQVEEVEHIPEAEQEQEPTKEQEKVKEMVKLEPEPLREEGHMQSELQEVLLQEGDEIKALVARNSMQKMVPAVNFDPETKMEVPEAPEQEQLNNNSYELKGEEVKSLPALPRRPTPPPKPSPPQLADGSHFMCV